MEPRCKSLKNGTKILGSDHDTESRSPTAPGTGTEPQSAFESAISRSQPVGSGLQVVPLAAPRMTRVLVSLINIPAS